MCRFEVLISRQGRWPRTDVIYPVMFDDAGSEENP